MRETTGASLAGASSNYDRVKDDFYATNPQSVRDLLDIADIKGDSFYENCVGGGHIAEVLKECFPSAKHFHTDLVYRGYGTGGVDFVSDDVLVNILGGKKVDWVVTNPPFKLAREFIDKSLEVTNTGVAMFLKIQFLEGQGRKEWFKKTPLKYVYVFSARQIPMRDGLEINPETEKKWSSTMCFAWFVWEHSYRGEPMIRWI